MATCSTTDVVCNALVYSQSIPSFVAVGCTAASYVTYNPIYFVYGLFLWVCQVVLWSFQIYFEMMRPVPFSAQYAFPSIEAFYVSSLCTIIIIYSALYGVRRGWSIWLALFILFVAPCFVLVFFQMHVFWQVLFSILLGSVVTMGFTLVLWLMLADALLYLQFSPPLSWMGFYGSTGWFEGNPDMMKRHTEIASAM
jgi:hypothetical protein